jgi:tetratricopeptide (TPR) repeat protein/DNA-binding transcriptional ArsR family regulator
MIDQKTPSLFTPSNTDPKILEAILVQRNEMLNDAVQRVKESANTGNKHHLLFVGPRGTGKTHLMTLLVHRLDQDIKLDKKLRIAWLNEDETTITLLDFLKRIYLALNKRHAEEFDKKSLDAVYDLKAEEAKNYISKLLLKKLKKHTLLVVVENLDALFEALKKSGQQELRAFIQENPVLSIVATAQKLTDDVSKRKSTFFGFFQTEQLKTLSVDEATELLEKISQLNKQYDVVKFLQSATGRSRIRALYHLSGGNHRIYIALSTFITRDSINQLVEPFSKMVDKMTPYYQERIRWLAPQQRQIIEYLCTCERPASVKKIARYLFSSNQSISSQLKNLREKGYVESGQRGRESLYEIAEPLMRICVEVKENQSTEPLRMLVDFLRIWYNGDELSIRLKSCDSAGVEKAYLKSAVEKNKLNGNLRVQLLVEGFRTEFGENLNPQLDLRIKDYASESEELVMAFGMWTNGDEKQAIIILEEIADKKNSYSVNIKVSAWMLMGEIYFQKREFASSIKCLDAILNLQNISMDQIAITLLNKGNTYGQLGDIEKAIIDLSAVIKLKEAPIEYVAQALCNRGFSYRKLGDTKKAITDLSAVIKLKEVPIKYVVDALINRGLTYGQLDDTDKELEDYTTVIKLKGATAEEIVETLIKRGLTYGQLDDNVKEIADYSAVIKFKEATAEQIAEALLFRGMTYGQLDDTDKEMADYNTCIKHKGASISQVSRALLFRGEIYWRKNDLDKSEKAFKALLQLDGVEKEIRATAHFNRIKICMSEGRWDAAMIILSDALKEGGNNDHTENTVDLMNVFFESSLAPKIREERITTLVKIYQDNNAVSQLGDVLIKHLGVLYSDKENLPVSDNLESWALAWEDALKNVDAFRLPQRIFRTGIDFLKSTGKDLGILLDLNQEERKILEQTLGLDDED